MFSKILAALGFAPKNLDEARNTYTEAKGALDSVAALFTAAGLNLEQMLAAGPESLKAHLESLDNSTELAEALQELEKTSSENEKLSADLAGAAAVALEVEKIFGAVGYKPGDNAKPEDFKASFDSHVQKQATLALAKTGHPPAHVPAASTIDDVTPTKTDDDKAALAALDGYIKLIEEDNKARTKATAEAKTKFYSENHTKIDRGMQIRRRS